MRQLFHTQLTQLEERIVLMGSRVAEMIDQATLSLALKDSDVARAVVAADDQIDQLLIDVQMESMRLLALQQPMARDLRRIGTAMKIVTDLERMADHATDIAEVTLRLEGVPLMKPLVDIPRMARLAQEMTRQALAAFVGQDEKLARSMIAMDDEVDGIYNRMFDELLGFMERDPSLVTQATHLLHVAVYLERVADHATNIGEWTIYMLTGQLEELNN